MYKKFLQGLAFAALLPFTANATSVCGPNEKNLQLCDISFVQIPTFATTMTTFSTQSGIYRIRNNTRATIALPSIRLIRNAGDTLASTASRIDNTVANACGSTLASGATCNIRVILYPTAAGTLSRFLRIGVDTRQCNLTSPIFTLAVTPIARPNIPGLPRAGSFYRCLILSSAALVNRGDSVVNGGVCSNSSIVGFPPGFALDEHEKDTVVTQALVQTEVLNAYLRGLCSTPFPPPEPTLSGTFTPGTYCLGGSPELTNITLDGAGSYYFVTEKGFSTAENARVTLSNGASAGQVFFSTNGQTELGDNTNLQGILVVGKASLRIGSNVVINGAIRSIGASVQMDQITASAP